MKLALLSAALAALVCATQAQISPCIQGCLTTAQSQAGCGALDISCMCKSTKFQADMLSCLKAKCTAADLAEAKKYEAQFCGSCACGLLFFVSPSSAFRAGADRSSGWDSLSGTRSSGESRLG
uniref:GPI-anchored CFEM domain protein B n=1 Tax=Ganoderma boninense TaxID=34458 RepID=A0A5K1JYS9_9APHY|nr:GPI-anchored CFEM domain protein B [Ganoderma boninense]